MDRQYSWEEDSALETSTQISSDPISEYDEIRLRTKSLEVTDTRQGQSALVPGLSPVKTPTDNRVKLKQFKNTYDSQRQPEYTSSDLPVQEVSRAFNSVRVYTTQTLDRIDHQTNNSETEPLLHNQSKWNKSKLRLKYWKLVVPMMISSFIILIVSSSILLHLSFDPGPLLEKAKIENEDMVLLGYFDTFYYKEIKIMDSEDNRCDECKVEVYSFYPDSLIVDDNFFNITSDIVTTTHDDVILSPKYLISGSKLKLAVTFFPTELQNTTVQFLLFNKLEDYEPFRRGDKPNAYQYYLSQVNTIQTTFWLDLTIEETAYYSIGIRPTEPLSLQFTLLVHQIYYSRPNFPPLTCLMESMSPCTIQFTPSPTDMYTDTLKTCVLVYSVPPTNVAKSYYVTLEYNLTRRILNTYSISMISLIGFSALCLSLLCCYWLCFCVYNGIKRRNRYHRLGIN